MTDYNPSEHNVDDVKDHVDKNPGDAQAVLDAEKARGDDARSTLVKHLEGVVEGQHPAPVAAEAQPVTVAPSATPTTRSFFGKEYEVTPEGGHRLKS